MARILLGEEWFEEIASTSLYEAEFETILRQEARKIFADYHVVPFKTIVMSDDGYAKPDLALIHRLYRRWWVVEVEMSHHSLAGHVLPQIRRLANARYGEEEANFLLGQIPDLIRDRLIDMLKGSPPRILVISNAPVPEWVDRLRAFDAIVTVFQIFRSQSNRYLYRLNGELPTEDFTIISTCRCWPQMHRFLEVHAPNQLEARRGDIIEIRHETGILTWQRFDIADRVLLHALRDHPLKPGKIYELVRSKDGALAIRLSKKRR